MTKINWTDEAIDAAAECFYGRGGYLRSKAKVRDHVRRILDTAVSVQGIMVVEAAVVEQILDKDVTNG